MSFDKAFVHTLAMEGHRNLDKPVKVITVPGEKFYTTTTGISQPAWSDFIGRPATLDDMKSITLEDTKHFYKKMYWDKCKCDDLSPGVAAHVFDMAVNAGARRGAKLLQRAIGAKQDGVIGPMSLNKANSVNPVDLVKTFSEVRLQFYKRLKSWPRYGKGWSSRNEATTKFALSLEEK